jgi:two-component system cell cycle sensor histidine kinase/response regulator CckA
MKTLLFAQGSAARAAIERELRARGHHLYSADDAERAWRLCSEHRFRLVVAADRVRGASTADFLQRLRRSSVAPALILLIVHSPRDTEALQQFIDIGVDDWLPCDATATLAALRLTLVERRLTSRSETQRVRDDLARTLLWQETIFEASGDAVFVSDAAGRLMVVNRAACELTGYDKAELLRFRMSDLHQSKDTDAGKRVRAGLAGGEQVVSQERLRRKDGRIVEAEFNSRAIMVAGSRYVHVTARDISERKRLEEERLELAAEMQHVQKLESLGVLAGGIAHDFNNLLVGILGNASLALADLPEDARVRETVQRIEAAAARAADLTKQLLAYSGKGKFVLEHLDISHLVSGMGSLLTSAVGTNVELEMHLSDSLPPVVADASEMRQVVVNLATNASESIVSQPGRVIVSTSLVRADRSLLSSTYLDDRLPEGYYVAITVDDNGVGMEEDVHRRMFEPFFSTKFPGRGLGLPAVLGIVRGHKGAIKVDSVPRQGTTVQVLLPCAVQPADRGLAFAGMPAYADREVLVVDDDPSVRVVAGQMLERAGYKPLMAGEGAEALKIYRERHPRPRVVLLDLMMPGIGGEETFRRLRSIDPDVRIIMSSGFSESDAKLDALPRDRSAFLQKPYRSADLIAKIREVLAPQTP